METPARGWVSGLLDVVVVVVVIVVCGETYLWDFPW
jgi:hypothetical protein